MHVTAAAFFIIASFHTRGSTLSTNSQSSMSFSNTHTGPSGTVKLAKKEPAAKPTAAAKEKKPAAKVHRLPRIHTLVRKSPSDHFSRKRPKQQNPPAPRQPADPKRPTRNPPPPKPRRRRPRPPRRQRPKPPLRPKLQKPTRRPNA